MIGVFDSGLGGLTVLKDFIKILPQYEYVYLGDNARAPYGDRPHEVLKLYTEQAVKFLFNRGCRLIIIACNTASSQVLRELQEEYLRKPGIKDKKILGVIRPLAEEAVKISKTGRIAIVGTRSTVGAQSYDHEIHKINPAIKIFSAACPLLVPLIEENWINKPETRMILKKYLLPLKSFNPDTLILGCTHYQFLYKDFVRIMGKNVRVPQTGKIIAASLAAYLKRHPEIEKHLKPREPQRAPIIKKFSPGENSANENRKPHMQRSEVCYNSNCFAEQNTINENSKLIVNRKQENKKIIPSIHFLTTGDPQRFKEIGSRFLSYPIDHVSKVEITAQP